MLFDNLLVSLPAVREGSVKPIAVTGNPRSPALPDIPAMAELLPGYELTSWAAPRGPAGMAPDLTAGMNERAVKSLNDPICCAAVRVLGATRWPTSPQEASHAFRDGGNPPAAGHSGGGGHHAAMIENSSGVRETR